MTPELFVQALVRILVGGTVPGFIRAMEDPPGQRPRQWLADLSEWYCGLDQADRDSAAELARRAAIAATRSVLEVLDGSLAVEDRGEKGDLVLTYEKHGEVVVLNEVARLSLDAEFGRLVDELAE